MSEVSKAVIVNLENLEGLPSFVPPHHTKTMDHKLVHSENGAQKLAIWHGQIEPGGEAEEHFHSDLEQSFLVLRGTTRFTLDGQEHDLGAGNLIFIPKGVRHRIQAVGQEPSKLMIIMTPPPSSDNQWHLDDA